MDERRRKPGQNDRRTAPRAIDTPVGDFRSGGMDRQRDPNSVELLNQFLAGEARKSLSPNGEPVELTALQAEMKRILREFAGAQMRRRGRTS